MGRCKISHKRTEQIFSLSNPKLLCNRALKNSKNPLHYSCLQRPQSFILHPCAKSGRGNLWGGKSCLIRPAKPIVRGPETPTTYSPREHQVYVPLSVPVLPPSPDHVDHALSELNQVPRHPGDVRPVDAKVLDADVEGGAHLVLDGGELAKEEKEKIHIKIR